jgi:hypothetical protein
VEDVTNDTFHRPLAKSRAPRRCRGAEQERPMLHGMAQASLTVAHSLKL